MPIEIRELIIRARVEPEADRAAQPVARPAAATGPRGIDEDMLERLLRDREER